MSLPKPAPAVIDAYVDVRSPFVYISLGPLQAIAARHGATFRWHLFAIDIAGAFGGADGRDRRQLAKVKYLYMDARRQAALQGLTIRGPRKVYDATTAHRLLIGITGDPGFPKAFAAIQQGFFDHSLDIESAEAVAERLGAALARPASDLAPAADAGARVAAAQEAAEAKGVFGVPTFVLDGETFWGSDRLALLDARLAARVGDGGDLR